ncbi:hypothetical protein ACFL0H_09285 [Thermodesulfobacteriota bacterium]
MTPEELRAVVEAAVKGAAGMNYLQIALLIFFAAIASFFGAFLKEKAKSAVTKSDIEKITRKVEEIKKDLEQRDRISSKKHELKYNACLNMLGILDAHISHAMRKDNQGNDIQVDRQHTTPEEARKCHNELLLTIDNQAILEIFLRMMVGKSDYLIVDLDKIRELVRNELGFGNDYRPDEENPWMAVIKCKNNG